MTDRLFRVLLLFLGPLASPATAYHPALSLRQCARLAEIAAVGRLEPGPGGLTLNVTRTLKGVPAAAMRLAWSGAEPLPSSSGTYLVFGTRKGADLVPLLGPNGLFRTTQKTLPDLEEAVLRTLEFDTAATAAARADVLRGMLAGPTPSRQAALEILYGDYGAPEIDSTALLAPVTALARGRGALAGEATQVLGRIGGPGQVPVLIELVGSPQKPVAQSAHSILSSWAGSSAPQANLSSAPGRTKAAQAWRRWWSGRQPAPPKKAALKPKARPKKK